MRNKAAWYLLAIFLLSYIPSQAQFTTSLNRYRNTRGEESKNRLQLHKRIYLGYGMQFMSNPFKLRIRDTFYNDTTSYNDKVNKQSIDTTIYTSAKLSKTLNAFLGVSVPVARVSPKSMVSLDIEANILMGEVSYDTIRIRKITDVRDTFYSENLPFMMMSGPISFNYKYGGDATLSKDNKAMFGAGLGVAASYITVEGGDALIKAVPFVKVEGGFFLGLAFKLRGTAYLGNYELLNTKTEKLGTASGILSRQYSGPLGYNVSIIVLPFSFTWDKPLIR